ncbi:methyltransferase domain-containing protein [Maricaulaceae bacterium MS644]
MTDEILAFNQAAWDRESAAGGAWSRAVDSARIERARRGDWSIILTPEKAVPRSWFPEDLSGVKLLALAGSGGQQAPVLAAAGASVTVFDLSAEQLARDREVAARDGLRLVLEQGDMADLSRFEDASFDLIVNPCSVGFAPDLEPVWREAARVLRPGGRLMTGVINPAFFLFDHDAPGEAARLARFALPYRGDAPEHRARAEAAGEPMQFSHSLETLLGGQLQAGLHLIDLYEDRWPGADVAVDVLTPLYIATLAQKRA